MIQIRPLYSLGQDSVFFFQITRSHSHTSLGSRNLLVSKDSPHSECVCMNVCKCMDCSGHARMDQLPRCFGPCVCMYVHASILTLLSSKFDEQNRSFFSSFGNCAVCMAKSGERKSSVLVPWCRWANSLSLTRLAACAQDPALHIEVGLYEPCACRSLIDTVVFKPVKCCGICDPMTMMTLWLLIVHHRSLGMCKANG